MMNRFDPAIIIPQIAYNRDFSISDLQQEIAGLLELRSINAGNEFQKEIARTAVTLLGRHQKIAPERRESIYREIDNIDHADQGDTNHE